MINEVIETLKTYTDGKDNAGKVEISVMQLNRIIKALEQRPTDAVDRVTIKEYLDSYNDVPEMNVGKIGKDTNAATKENNNEQMEFPDTWEEFELCYGFYDTNEVYTNGSRLIPSFRVKQWLEHQMTAEDYRQRMMQAFHNADCGELIAVCVLPTEKEFEHLEWLLKNHYKKEPCEDCIRRSDIGLTDFEIVMCNGDYKEALKMLLDKIEKVPSVTPQPKIGSSSEKPNKWIPVSERLPEETGMYLCSYDDDDVGISYFDIRMNEFNIFHEQVTAWMPLQKPYKAKKEV